MKSILFLFFLVFAAATVQGQDIIVRITGDTVHVKVHHSNDDFIYYQSSQTRRGQLDVISRLEVSSILYNFEAAPADLKKAKNQLDRGYDIFEGWFLYGGYYLPIVYNGSDDFIDYYKKLQFGSGFRGGFQIFLNQNMGIGALYSQSNYRNSADIQVIQTGQTGKIQNDILLKYAGAIFVYRIDFQNVQSSFEIFAGAGYTWYSDNAKLIDSYVIRGGGFTGNVSAAFNISIGQGIYIPVKLAVDGINVTNLRIDLEDESTDISQQLKASIANTKKEDVSRISATIGLLISF